MCKRRGSRFQYFLFILHSRRYRSRWRRPSRLREINAINGLQMKRLLNSGQHRDDCQERPAQLKGHLTHLLLAQLEIKFAVSRPRFLFAARQHNRNDLFICRNSMINYECFTIIWKGARGRDISFDRPGLLYHIASMLSILYVGLLFQVNVTGCIVAQITWFSSDQNANEESCPRSPLAFATFRASPSSEIQAASLICLVRQTSRWKSDEQTDVNEARRVYGETQGYLPPDVNQQQRLANGKFRQAVWNISRLSLI